MGGRCRRNGWGEMMQKRPGWWIRGPLVIARRALRDHLRQVVEICSGHSVSDDEGKDGKGSEKEGLRVSSDEK